MSRGGSFIVIDVLPLDTVVLGCGDVEPTFRRQGFNLATVWNCTSNYTHFVYVWRVREDINVFDAILIVRYILYMRTILCIGSSHTEGGYDGDVNTKEFFDSWPGILETWLHSNGHEDDVINLGEASYSVDQYPFKLIESVKRWPITDVIVEVNTQHKLDIEISEQLHGDKVKGTALEDRYSVATRQGRSPFVEKDRKYRTSVSSTEAVDYYNTWRPGSQHAKSYTVKQKADEMRDGQLNPQVKTWVKEKLEKITNNMVGTDRAMDILLDHMYFRAVYDSLSDHSIIKYCSQIDHMVEICKRNNINVHLWFMHETTEWSNHSVYKNTFRDRWQDCWLFDKELYAHKPWLLREYSREQIQEWLADSIHFKPPCYKDWINKHLGPWLLSKR